MLKVYLDTSVFNRPFDDQSQPRIWLETMAFVVILRMAVAGEIALVRSTVHDYENSRNPHALRQQWVRRCLDLADDHQSLSAATLQRARDLERTGLKALDALHVACAEVAETDYFLTCDDQLTRRYAGHMSVMNPAAFIVTLDTQQEEQGDGREDTE